MKCLICLIWITCLRTIIFTESARILGIVPVPSYSHQISYRQLWISLSQQGHEVVIITTDPINDPHLTNLTEIDCRSNYEFLEDFDFVKFKYLHMSWLDHDNILWKLRNRLTVNILEHPTVRKMFAPNSGQKFDVVLVEIIMTPVFYVLGHRFNAPIIGLTSIGLNTYNNYLLGAPILTSHPSSWELEIGADFNMSFWQKIKNFVRIWYRIYIILEKMMPQEQAIAEKYFGKNIPHLIDIERNISIILSSEQSAISFIRPLPPNVIKFGNFHIMKEQVALPKDLKKILDDAPNGFIYVSLGTNVLMSSFPKDVQNMFRDVFANLPCKVVWKRDTELPDKSDNIYVAKWFPQQTVLAHPKIRLFIYQGGHQSTEEAVYYTVPLLGLPILGDQETQVRKMVTLGVAKKLDVTDISKEKLNESIINMLNNKRFKERMIKVKELNEDQPMDPLENAIWWIEFVIRHKGAPHLQNDISNYPWYQRYDIDVIAVLSVVIFVILFCALIILYTLLKIIYYHYTRKSAIVKNKIN